MPAALFFNFPRELDSYLPQQECEPPGRGCRSGDDSLRCSFYPVDGETHFVFPFNSINSIICISICQGILYGNHGPHPAQLGGDPGCTMIFYTEYIIIGHWVTMKMKTIYRILQWSDDIIIAKNTETDVSEFELRISLKEVANEKDFVICAKLFTTGIFFGRNFVRLAGKDGGDG